MTAISILGTGRVATTLATGLAGAGHRITLGSRHADTASPVPDAVITDLAGAVAASPITINATPGDTALDRLSALAAPLEGKILVDVTNATTHGADGMPGTLVYPSSSLAEQLQAALPQTAVVKTLNTMLFSVMADPGSVAEAATVFLSGDDSEAKDTVRGLLRDLGWVDDRILDLGGVRTARGPEAAALFVPDVIRARGFAPFAISVVH